MAENLPEPKSRTESYLAKAAGEDVTIPEKPESRLEQYLAAIAEGGGGGGGGSYTAGDGITIENNTISADLVQYAGSSKTQIMSQKAVSDFISGAKSIKLITDLPFNYPENNPDGYIIDDLFSWQDIYYADVNSVKLYYSENDYINFSGYLQVGLCDYSYDDYEIYTYGFTITKLNGTSNTPEIYVGQTQYIPEHWDDTLEDDVPASWTSLSFEQVGAGGGGSPFTMLTSADYNYPVNNPNAISPGLLEPGLYMIADNNVYVSTDSYHMYQKGNVFCVTQDNYMGSKYVIQFIFEGYASAGTSSVMCWSYNPNTGKCNTGSSRPLLDKSWIWDGLDMSYSGARVLDAYQGKVLKDLIDALDARVTALEGN